MGSEVHANRDLRGYRYLLRWVMANLTQFIESIGIYLDSRGVGNILQTPNGWTYSPASGSSKGFPLFKTSAECFHYLEHLPDQDLM